MDDTEGVEDISPAVARVFEGHPGCNWSNDHFRAQRGACPALASERRRKREYLWPLDSL